MYTKKKDKKQGFLNEMWMGRWKMLPYTYNFLKVSSSSCDMHVSSSSCDMHVSSSSCDMHVSSSSCCCAKALPYTHTMLKVRMYPPPHVKAMYPPPHVIVLPRHTPTPLLRTGAPCRTASTPSWRAIYLRSAQVLFFLV